MEMDEAWIWYVGQHVPKGALTRPPTEFIALQTLESFFDLHPMFTMRWDAINATPYSTEFDEIVDGALAQMAMADHFDGWEELPAGAWRVLAERLLYSEAVLAAMWAKEPETVIDRLPAGLSPERQSKALLLKYLLGSGRTIDRQMLRAKPDGSLPSFPAMQTLRRQ